MYPSHSHAGERVEHIRKEEQNAASVTFLSRALAGGVLFLFSARVCCRVAVSVCVCACVFFHGVFFPVRRAFGRKGKIS